MANTETLLQQAKSLSKAKKYDAVISLLDNKELQQFQSADLYAEKAEAYHLKKKYEMSEETADKALQIDSNHAKANHYKATRQRALNKFVDAIASYKKAIETDPSFLLSYNGLGGTYYETGNYEEAKHILTKAIKINPNFSYAYNWLGNVYLETKQYGDALKCFEKNIELDPKDVFPHYNLGRLFFALGKYVEAIDEYKTSLELDPKFAFSYNALGHAYNYLGNYNEAKTAFTNAINLDITSKYSLYNRGLVNYNLGEYGDALSDFEQFIELTKDTPDIFTERAQEKAAEVKKILENLDYRNISELVIKIKDLLLHKDGCVTHYTGFSTTKKLVLEKSLFRLSEGAFLNDTAEGRSLFDFINFHSIVTRLIKDTEAKPFGQKPFIGSFVTETKHDDLALWRMYGKEDKDEAKGCAITIDADALIEGIRKKLLPEGETTSTTEIDEDLKFYRVAYQTPDELFIIPGSKGDEASLNEYMHHLRSRVSEFNKNVQTKEDRDTQVKNVLEVLNSIAYLFKSAEYQYEQELRLVVKKTIGFEKIVILNDNEPKVYIELVEITPMIRKITFGPKVDKRDEWAAIFYYTLEKDKHKPDIYISHLPFK